MPTNAVDPTYLDTSLTPEERTAILVRQMTLEEKAGQLMQITCMKADPKFEEGKATGWIYSRMAPDERQLWARQRGAGSFLHVLGHEIDIIQSLALETRLGIPVLFGIDAIHGHALKNGATIFPSQLGMSCSWNPELVEAMGRVTAQEVAADGIHWTFSPVLCVARDPRWGRVDETFGEDPYLIGELGAAAIRGYQGASLSDSDSILACAKHYIAYGESTGGRDSYDAPISLRKVREVFLEPFKKAVEAGCATFMTGYQSIDSTPMTAHEHLIRHVLKEDLNFKGFVVTDWNNTESLVTQQCVSPNLREATRLTLASGNDLFMNTPGSYECLIDLVKQGDLQESILDDAVSRILLIKFQLGLFEKVKGPLGHRDQPVNAGGKGATEAALATNLALTRQSIVLLENKEETLPLSNEIKTIAVIGPNAHSYKNQVGDWTYFTHPIPKEEVPQRPYYTMLEGIQEVASRHGTHVAYSKGCALMDHELSEAEQEALLQQALIDAGSADLLIAVVGDGLDQNGEFKDRGDLNLPKGQQRLLEALKATGKPLVIVLVNGKPLTIPRIKAHADAVLETFNAGMLGGLAVGEILFGEVNPSGRLSVSFPAHVGQIPVYYNQLPGWHGSKYMDLPMAPLYPFGYGLSYSTIEYGEVTVNKTVLGQAEAIDLSILLTNCGPMAADEVVQVYVRDKCSSVMTPFKQLKAFKRVNLGAGATERVTFNIPVKQLSLVNQFGNEVVEPGEFEILVGPSSEDQVLKRATIVVQEVGLTD